MSHIARRDETLLPRARLSQLRIVTAMNVIDETRARRELPAPTLARAIREAAGVSQSAVARGLGVTRMTVCRWESGRCRPSIEHLAAYAEILRALHDETRGQR